MLSVLLLGNNQYLQQFLSQFQDYLTSYGFTNAAPSSPVFYIGYVATGDDTNRLRPNVFSKKSKEY